MTAPRFLLALLFALLTGVVQAQLAPVPPLTSHLTDQAHLLDAQQHGQLEALLADYEAKTGSQIAVLLVDSSAPEAIEQYSIRVTDAWKLGRKGVDDGVLLLVAKNNPPALRRLRIEAGRGVQGVLTDAQSKRILQDVIAPHFRQNDYAGGLTAGVGAIASLLNAEKFPPAPQARGGSSDNNGGGWVFLAFVAFILMSLFRSGGRRQLGHGGWASGAAGFIIGSALGGMRGGGGGGGGFGGGGGMSGGGGGFDGGGASGDW